jgi:hypothetical protein
VIARVATVEGGDPSRSGEVLSHVREHVIPEMRAAAGLKRAMTLLDRENRKVLAISFWDSEDDLRSADEKMEKINRALPDIGQRRTGVAVYEVILDEDVS